jgi:anti-sigma factor RsiW
MIFRRLYLRLTGDYACQRLVETITEYLEGTMPAAERARFERHLQGCPSCQLYVEQLRCTIEQSGHVTVGDVEALPEQARDDLMEAFRAFHAGR